MYGPPMMERRMAPSYGMYAPKAQGGSSAAKILVLLFLLLLLAGLAGAAVYVWYKYYRKPSVSPSPSPDKKDK